MVLTVATGLVVLSWLVCALSF